MGDVHLLPDTQSLPCQQGHQHAVGRHNPAYLVGKAGATDALEDAAHLLLDQARILEGEPLPEPGMFSKRLADLLTRSLET